jgi:hypothetical protein
LGAGRRSDGVVAPVPSRGAGFFIFLRLGSALAVVSVGAGEADSSAAKSGVVS